VFRHENQKKELSKIKYLYISNSNLSKTMLWSLSDFQHLRELFWDGGVAQGQSACL
jgi:hypothetical protein